MSETVIFDTSIIVDQIRSNRHSDRVLNLDGLVRNSSVVLAELWRGASSAVDRRVIESLERNNPTFSPTEKNWVESGHLLGKIRVDKGFEPQKLRDLHFDVLIALTARSSGSRLITSNRADFEMICGYREFKLELW
jgi:predicted nucleic acid-binding protein